MMTKLAVLIVCSALSLGCDALGNCPAESEPVTMDTGTTDVDALVYASGPIDGPRTYFPAKTFVHFVHDLGYMPDDVNTKVSFTELGSDSSENTGNQGRIKCVDDHEIVIKNDTCEEDFWIQVSASAALKWHARCPCTERNDNGKCPGD